MTSSFDPVVSVSSLNDDLSERLSPDVGLVLVRVCVRCGGGGGGRGVDPLGGGEAYVLPPVVVVVVPNALTSNTPIFEADVFVFEDVVPVPDPTFPSPESCEEPPSFASAVASSRFPNDWIHSVCPSLFCTLVRELRTWRTERRAHLPSRREGTIGRLPSGLRTVRFLGKGAGEGSV